MPARILDGQKIRDEIFGELKGEITKLSAQGIRPGLAAVLVGGKSRVAAVCEKQDRGVRGIGNGELAAHAAGQRFDGVPAAADEGFE